MSINTDNVKAGDWVQVANGDWYRVDKATGFKHRPLIVINNTWRALGDIADLLTAHLTAEEVEANGLPVGNDKPKQEPDVKESLTPATWLTEEELEYVYGFQYDITTLNAFLTAKFGNPDDLVSKAEVDRIVEDALHSLKAQVARAVFDNDYMWDDLAELGINPELEKESNE
jgi:hypothetical protein